MTLECHFADYAERILLELMEREAQTGQRWGGKKAHPQLSPFKAREETLTESLVMGLAAQFPGVVTAFTTGREASVSGADWLCIMKTKNTEVRLLIQAKRPNTAFRYPWGPWVFDLDSRAVPANGANPGRAAWHQRDLLIKHAGDLRATPFYGLYAPDWTEPKCDQVPRRDGYWHDPQFLGTLHLYDANCSSDPLVPDLNADGLTLSSLMCCSKVRSNYDVSKFVRDEQTIANEEQIFGTILRMQEEGIAPKIVSTFDFGDVDETEA